MAYVLSVGQVDSSEERVVLGAGLACVVLVQEDGGAPHLQAELLDALLVVDGQQEGLAALLGLHCGQDGEVLRERITWSGGGGGRGGEVVVTGGSFRELGMGTFIKKKNKVEKESVGGIVRL